MRLVPSLLLCLSVVFPTWVRAEDSFYKVCSVVSGKCLGTGQPGPHTGGFPYMVMVPPTSADVTTFKAQFFMQGFFPVFGLLSSTNPNLSLKPAGNTNPNDFNNLILSDSSQCLNNCDPSTNFFPFWMDSPVIPPISPRPYGLSFTGLNNYRIIENPSKGQGVVLKQTIGFSTESLQLFPQAQPQPNNYIRICSADGQCLGFPSGTSVAAAANTDYIYLQPVPRSQALTFVTQTDFTQPINLNTFTGQPRFIIYLHNQTQQTQNSQPLLPLMQSWFINPYADSNNPSSSGVALTNNPSRCTSFQCMTSPPPLRVPAVFTLSESRTGELRTSFPLFGKWYQGPLPLNLNNNLNDLVVECINQNFTPATSGTSAYLPICAQTA